MAPGRRPRAKVPPSKSSVYGLAASLGVLVALLLLGASALSAGTPQTTPAPSTTIPPPAPTPTPMTTPMTTPTPTPTRPPPPVRGPPLSLSLGRSTPNSDPMVGDWDSYRSPRDNKDYETVTLTYVGSTDQKLRAYLITSKKQPGLLPPTYENSYLTCDPVSLRCFLPSSPPWGPAVIGPNGWADEVPGILRRGDNDPRMMAAAPGPPPATDPVEGLWRSYRVGGKEYGPVKLQAVESRRGINYYLVSGPTLPGSSPGFFDVDQSTSGHTGFGVDVTTGGCSPSKGGYDTSGQAGTVVLVGGAAIVVTKNEVIMDTQGNIRESLWFSMKR